MPQLAGWTGLALLLLVLLVALTIAVVVTVLVVRSRRRNAVATYDSRYPITDGSADS